MKLGFLSAILPDVSFDKVLAFAAVNRFACVEVACWPVGKAERRFAGVTHLDVAKFTAARADDVHALTLARGVTISALGYYPNPLDPDTAVAKRCGEHLKQVIRAARLLGLKTVNTFVGRDWTKSVDENWPRFLKVWKPLIAFAEDHDVRIGIENCPMLFTRDEWPGGKNLATSPAIWRRMFADIPSEHFGLNFDPSHFVLQHIEPASALREFREKLFHVHAKDARILCERLNEVGVFAFPKEWHQPRIPGFGDIDWARFIAALVDAGYDGPVVIEIEDDTFGHSLAGRQRALKTARNILAPYVI